MNTATDLARMVPGFDFLQGLLKNASAGLPSMGQWIAPTLDPAELEKRIQELKTVHFWLEQNARLMAATIQAMEVQRMTLTTLQGMNVPLADLTAALKIKLPDIAMPKAAAVAEVENDKAGDEAESAAPAAGKPVRHGGASKAEPAAGVVDPLQWWGALTKQFSELAAKVVNDGPADPGAARVASKSASKSAGQGAARKATARKAPARKVAAAVPSRSRVR